MQTKRVANLTTLLPYFASILFRHYFKRNFYGNVFVQFDLRFVVSNFLNGLFDINNLTVYFKMEPEKLVSRLESSKTKRPLIKDKNREELIRFITVNLEKREPFYSRAKLIVDGDRVSDEYIANHVAAYLSSSF